MKQTLGGKVVSNKMRNTVVVEVLRTKKHPIYGKYIKISKKYKAHFGEEIPVGKNVVIQSTKPKSSDKKWEIIKIL